MQKSIVISLFKVLILVMNVGCDPADVGEIKLETASNPEILDPEPLPWHESSGDKD